MNNCNKMSISGQRAQGYILMEVMMAVVLVTIFGGELIQYYYHMAATQIRAIKRMEALMGANSIIDKISIDRSLRGQGRYSKDGITYTWECKKMNDFEGVSIIDLTTEWQFNKHSERVRLITAMIK